MDTNDKKIETNDKTPTPLADSDLDHVAGGISFTFEKISVKATEPSQGGRKVQPGGLIPNDD
ncbi:MAG: hypothetical protein IPL75_06345 [Acidobacteria bacterium]|mgnify:FL=1|nr:hypothetical protein [Acidobacteriota bacterium]